MRLCEPSGSPGHTPHPDRDLQPPPRQSPLSARISALLAAADVGALREHTAWCITSTGWGERRGGGHGGGGGCVTALGVLPERELH